MEKQELTRLMDMAKRAVFMNGKQATFLSSIMCSLKFHWSNSIGTAATDGVNLYWNKEFFLSLQPKTRETILLHEIWHVARLHHLRGAGLDPELWNVACDIKINNELIKEGYSFDGLGDFLKSDRYDSSWSEEDIYKDLLENNPNMKMPQPQFMSSSGKPSEEGDEENEPNINPGNANGDLLESSGEEESKQALNNVIQATQQAKLSGEDYSSGLGDIDMLVDTFLKPQVSWNNLLMNFMRDNIPDEDTNWNIRNRRFRNVFLPSSTADKEQLSHLVYYIDVSGSVSDEQVQKFASEVFYVHNVFKPSKITIIPFDTRLREPIEIRAEDKFPALNFTGRGGTSLVPVRMSIEELKPTAAIIFSDLWCPPMEEVKTPVIWIVMDNPEANPSFGLVAHIK